MEIQNASTTPSKSNQLRNVNTVRWESGNVTAQPWEINNRKSTVIKVNFDALSVKPCGHDTGYSSCPITFKCHMQVVDFERTNCEVDLLFNVTINDISVIYVTAHRYAGGLKKLDQRSGSQRHRHFVGFFNVPVQAPTRDHPFYTVIPRNRPI